MTIVRLSWKLIMHEEIQEIVIGTLDSDTFHLLDAVSGTGGSTP